MHRPRPRTVVLGLAIALGIGAACHDPVRTDFFKQYTLVAVGDQRLPAQLSGVGAAPATTLLYGELRFSGDARYWRNEQYAPEGLQWPTTTVSDSGTYTIRSDTLRLVAPNDATLLGKFADDSVLLATPRGVFHYQRLRPVG